MLHKKKKKSSIFYFFTFIFLLEISSVSDSCFKTHLNSLCFSSVSWLLKYSINSPSKTFFFPGEFKLFAKSVKFGVRKMCEGETLIITLIPNEL